MTIDLVSEDGRMTYRHITHDDDVFVHEPKPDCVCGPHLESQNFSAELRQGFVVYIHPVLALK